MLRDLAGPAVLSAAAAAPPLMVVPPEPAAGRRGRARRWWGPRAGARAHPAPGAPADTAWIGEAFSDLLPRALLRAGVNAVTRDDRLRAQAALEIPPVALTRATSIRLAEALGATRLVVGTTRSRATPCR